jgi:sulfite exporter TauE/SafE
MSMQEWASFACPNCKARLRIKPSSRSISLILIGTALGGLGRFHLVARWLDLILLIVQFTCLIAASVYLVLEYRTPKLQLKKPLPKPEISLNLSDH